MTIFNILTILSKFGAGDVGGRGWGWGTESKMGRWKEPTHKNPENGGEVGSIFHSGAQVVGAVKDREVGGQNQRWKELTHINPENGGEVCSIFHNGALVVGLAKDWEVVVDVIQGH